MLEQVGNALTFFAQYLVAGAKGTGLTITCTVYKGSTGAALVTDQSAAEIGASGVYKYQLASGYVDAEDDYVAVFNEVAATADQADVAAMWVVGRAGVENLDAAVSSRATVANVLAELVPGSYANGTAGYAIGLISAGKVVTVGPAVGSTALTLVRNDSYDADEQRALSFSSEAWPDLTGVTELRLTVRRRPQAFGNEGDDDVLLSVTDNQAFRVVGAGTQTVVFEMSASDTSALLPGNGTGKFDVQATLPSIVTLITGFVNVTEDQTRPT